MDRTLVMALRTGGGVVRWAAAREASVPRWAIDHGVRSKRLVRLLPGIYADASRADDAAVRRRAALAYADGGSSRQPRSPGGEGGGGALSHTSALAVWGLVNGQDLEREHVTVAHRSTPRSRGWLVVHHSLEAPQAVMRDGFAVTRLEQSLVDAWSCLPAARRRAPVIAAVNGRLTTAQRLGDALAAAPKLTGRAELRGLLAKLAAGCRSALEIWGDDHVFASHGMPGFARQVPIRLDHYTAYLDVYHEETRVDFELDGASVHGSSRQREIDLRRDAELAARGILVVRLSHARLTEEPEAVRREVLTILRNRG
jgi:very-short-patch-repair endonuclease